MPRRWRTRIGRAAALGLLGALLLPAAAHRTPAGEPEDRGYTPVAPPAAVHAACAAHFKVVRDWLDQDDFISAAQAAQGLTVLARLYGCQGTQPRWRERTAALERAAARLAAAARARDAAGCAACAREYTDLLAALAKDPPPGPPAPDPSFRAFGSSRVWMLLMEGAYVDAKTARTAAEAEQLAYALAEEANVLARLRGDPHWRALALDVRSAALDAAATARAPDREAARRALKAVYQRCEACHQGYQR